MKRKWPLPERVLKIDDEIRSLFETYHPYKSVGKIGQIWVCKEREQIVAVWVFAPPALGTANSVSMFHQSVLSLSRMVAIPKSQRTWHISKPLKWIMKNGIDRTRWPVLVTYSDAGEGHCGHVYKCSGWTKTTTTVRKKLKQNGVRVSVRKGGKTVEQKNASVEYCEITKWVNRVCPSGGEQIHMIVNGWIRIPIPGKKWASGNQAYKIVKR